MLASTTTRNAYTAAGGASFPYTFRILDESHILVLKNGLAQTREDAADKACMISQQINDLVNSCLRVNMTESVNMQLPAVASRANLLLGFASNGTPLMVAVAN